MLKLNLFNPTCELALENGSKSYMPPASLVAFERDLDLLPIIYSQNDSLTAITKPLNSSELRYFEWLYGQKLALFTLEDEDIETESFKITPWGFAPNICHQLKQLSGGKIYNAQWKSEWRAFLSRQRAIELLHNSTELLKRLEFNPPFMPTMVKSMEEIYALANSSDFVVKSLWSSSGRGVFITRDGKLTRNELNMITSYFRKGEMVVVEPYFKKVVDFSMQFIVDSDQKVSYKATSLFETDSQGRYIASLVGADNEKFYAEYAEAFGGQSLLEIGSEVGELIEMILLKHPSNPFHSEDGKYTERAIGVDMMIYRNSNGKFKLHPCIEINWRYTMGYVAHCLTERIGSDLHGRLVVGQIADWKQRCKSSIETVDFNTKPFTSPGFYPLNRWDSDVQFGAYLELVEMG